ncbi:MAG: aminoacyl-tRNA hydrolase [Deltaproteobacteria bacterium]|nr:aminoacyl-tRNA hydrolase [Deltaproteobacteria bacterium]
MAENESEESEIRCGHQKCFMIVGLGNPGPRYAKTRHNIGFEVIEAISREFAIFLKMHPANARVGRGRIRDREVVLVQPMAYMNLSGNPVYQLAQSFGLSCNDMLIVHDDMDLSFGRIKIKEKGGSGGHKGIQSLMDAFGGGDFARLRMGIGRPEAGTNAVDHVLSSFKVEESNMLERIISRAWDAAVTVLCNGAKEAMNRFNRSIITISSQTTDGGK